MPINNKFNFKNIFITKGRTLLSKIREAKYPAIFILLLIIVFVVVGYFLIKIINKNNYGRFFEQTKQRYVHDLTRYNCNRVGYVYSASSDNCHEPENKKPYLEYRNNEEGVAFYYPPVWHEINKMPENKFVTNPKIILQRQGTSCVIAYGTINDSKLLSVKGATSSKMGFSNPDVTYLDVITVPFLKDFSFEKVNIGYSNAKLIAVPHSPYTFSTSGFLLMTKNKEPLMSACYDEFNRITHNKVINYEPIKWSNKLNGNLSIKTQYFSARFPHNSENVTLLFEDSETKKKSSIVPNLNTENFQSAFLAKGKLYFMDGAFENPIIKFVDIYTGEAKTVPLQYNSQKPVHSFFIKDDKLYYLEGVFCNEYLAKCKNMSLVRFDIKSGVTEKLSAGITSRDITGFDSSGDVLIMDYSDGDAGCGFSKYEAFTLSTKTLKKLGESTSCYDDPEWVVDQYKKLVVGSDRFDHLVVKDGVILLPKKVDKSSMLQRIQVNTSEYPYEK